MIGKRQKLLHYNNEIVNRIKVTNSWQHEGTKRDLQYLVRAKHAYICIPVYICK